jgi:hypothetical protein
MFYLSLTQINRALLTLSLLFLQQYMLIVWMLVAPMIWKCRQAGSTWESQNNHSNYEILLRIKIFRQSQISGVHIGDSSSSGVCRYEKELQLQSFRKFLDRTTELFFSGQRTEAMFLAQMHAYWLDWIRAISARRYTVLSLYEVINKENYTLTCKCVNQSIILCKTI